VFGVRSFERAGLVARHDVTLGTLMERLAKVHGNRRMAEEADGGLRLTYAQASKRVNRWAGAIAARTVPGDRVVIATPNGYEQVLLCLAASRAGALPAPVNSEMAVGEVAHVVRDSGATLVVNRATEVDDAEPLTTAVPSGPDDLAALFYTSGTTGKPKGAELTHRGLVGGVAAAAAWPAGLRRDEAVVSLPVSHIMGFAVVLGMACAGIPVFFLPSFNPVKVLDAIESREATMFIGVPAMFRMMLEAGAAERDLSSVRVWGSGADAMPAELAARFKRFGATAKLPIVGAVGEASFFEGYGMVESGGGVAVRFSPPLSGIGLGSSVGMALPGYRFKVVDDTGAEVPVGAVGDLLVRGPGLLKGYHGDADATDAALTADGWLRTGDLARRGSLGFVSFAGRKNDVIKRGGYSVYAVEIEQALEDHPAVLEAAVVGLPDERQGEVPAAAVRLEPGTDLDAIDLGGWLAERVAAYKVPVRFLAVDDLPRTGTNKVQRGEVLRLFD
jgi:acyl-coenzyme A synthetase/AMP-(fatty) acid ligase